MKNKDFSQKILKLKHLFWLKSITVLIIITMLFLPSIMISANNEFRVENCNKCEEYSQKLGQEINAFIELDTEPQKTVSSMKQILPMSPASIKNFRQTA